MGNSFSTNELKACIAQDLKIDVAFPFFPAGRNKGSTACCVVDTEWIDKLTSRNDADDFVTLKGPGRHANPAISGGPIGNIQQQQKQSPTTNIYVNVLSKDPQKRNNLQLYQQSDTFQRDNSQSTSCTRRAPNWWLVDNQYFFPVDNERVDSRIDELVDSFGGFDSIFTGENASLSYEERHKIFVKRIRQMLWPRSRYFQVAKHDSPNELLLKEDKSDTLPTELAANMSGVAELTNANLPEVFAVIESSHAYYFLAPYRGTTLQDLITYNPGVLSSNLKKSFVVYQIIRALAGLHSRGVLHGSLKASSILIDENLWTQLAGMEYGVDSGEIDVEQSMQMMSAPRLTKEIQEEPLVMKWVRGEISNFSYLMALNHFAGRREGDPNFHPVLPWITDFSGSKIEDGWRDFTKTKFRMNKGDEQLDFTFDGPVPHHITDILSDITYYVYLARRTPIPVLCQFVRSKYEPNEYPSSMQRLYSWTPDECIPEFYTDPSIFTSIHPDMPDLQIPEWADSPEDFIRKHAEALESDYVSENLHHWIDLTFGNNLTGKGAVEAKNVALPLLAGQNSFMKHGIIQLFKDKHPQRGCNWNKAKRTCESSMARYTGDMDVQQSPNGQTVPVDGQSNYSTQSLPSQLSLKAPRQYSISPPQGNASGSPSSNSLMMRERASSIHSNSSTVDTMASTTSRSISTVAAAEHASAASNGLTLSLRTDPIRLPSEMPEEYFVENLTHYEETMEFSAKYKFMQRVTELTENPMCSKPKQIYNIDPCDAPPLPNNEFSRGTAYDMFCAGEIIQSIFTAGNAKVVDFDGEPAQTSASGYFEVGNGDVDYDIAPTGRINVPPAVTGVVSALMAEDWRQRPSAKAILCASSSIVAVRNPSCSFPFPECIPEMYEYLSAFHQAEWSRRLYLADKWIDRICDLEDEAFMLILPTFTQLFTHDVTRVGSISLFPKLAQRMGPEKARQYLLKPIVFMFETLRPNIPKVLFEQKIVDEFVRRLGTAIFLQQMLPCYLESLAINSNEPKFSLEVEVANAASDSASRSVPELAGDALVHICNVLGPILTSKHIIRQLVKIALRDNTVKPVVLHTISQIAKNFGETFTSIQYSYLVSLLEQHHQRTLNERSTRTICGIMMLLEQLIPHISGQSLATELKSGYVSTLYKMLEPLPPKIEDTDSISDQSMRLRLTLSMRTIEHLIHITRRLSLDEWETTMKTMLQKYFSGFTTTTTNDDGQAQGPVSDAFMCQKIYQMQFVYSQFYVIVGKETMHRIIPTSEAIEKLMFEEFSSEDLPNNEPDASLQSTVSGSATDRKVAPSDKQKGNAYFKIPEKGIVIDFATLYDRSIKGLDITLLNSNALALKQSEAKDAADDKPSRSNTKQTTTNSPSQKNVELKEKLKVPTSVLPWKTKWKPSPEDRKNWNRFLSTNSEEMSKSVQFSFNDLKLRGYAGHTGAVRTIAVNEPAKLFASGSRDRTVKLWSLNIHEGIENWETSPYSECLNTYTGHKRGTINDVFFLPGLGNGLTDVMASCDGHVHLWDPETGKTIHQFSSGRPSIVTVKPIFQYRNLVGGTLEGNLTFFDVHNQKLLHTWKSSAGMAGSIRIIAVNLSGTLIAVGFSTGAISLIESRTGTLVASWKGGDTEIALMKFYTDELLVSCAPADHLICCWSVSRLALVKTMSVQQDVISLDLFKDEILTINNNNSVSFIPVNDELQSYSSKFKSSIIKSQVSAFAIVPTDPSLLFGCAEGEIFLYA